MNGPAHYAKAEQHLAWSAGIETDGDEDSISAWHQRQAQAHLTAALVAAVIATAGHRINPADRHEWLKAIDPDYAAEQAAEATP